MQQPERRTDFHEKTDTFELIVSLQGDQLQITLKDLIDWIIYSKKFTKNDIGGSIHNKMDLLDVYNAFLQNKVSEEQDKVNQKVGSRKNYEFGMVVEHKGNTCFKIQKGGKITAYLVIIDKKTKKDIIYESNLELNKVRNMKEIEIETERVDIKKKCIFNEFNKKLYKKDREKDISLKFMHLQHQIRVLKESKKTQKQNNLKFEVSMCQLTQINKQLIEKVQQLTEQNQRLQPKFILLMQQFEIQNQRNLDKFTEIQPLIEPIRASQNIHSLQQANKGYFSVDGLKVTYTGADQNITQYMFNKKIINNQSLRFKLKVTKMKSTNIGFGVVDYAKQKDSRDSFNSRNAMCYVAGGFKWPDRKNEGDGFKNGDVVELNVDRAARTVKYLVNGVLKASHCHQMLAGVHRVFVPYVEIQNTNDEVQWILDQ